MREVLKELRREFEKRDPAWSAVEQAGGTLLEKLMERYGEDPFLKRRLDDPMCASLGMEEYVREYQFFLGLQMGLELGGMDLLPEEPVF